jgi:pyruvate dehydrogenase E2 component (dihydrolipoamide acetyltransferase)
MLHEFKLPSLGDGVTGKVTEILVKAGDQVSKEQVVIIVGTDKVDAEMPIDTDGVIREILVNKGDDVTEGSLILRMESSPVAAAVPVAPAPVATASATTAPAAPASVPPAPAAAAPVAATGGSYEFKLPSLGDGVTGKITEILVKAGDTLQKDQIIMVVGTDKVDAEMPIDQAGVVEAVLVNKGDEVTEGTVVLKMTTSGAVPTTSQSTPSPAPVATQAAPAAASPAPSPAPLTTAAPSEKGSHRVSPLARKRAKELGVNLNEVNPAPGASRVSYKDVIAFVKTKLEKGSSATVSSGNSLAAKTLPNFEKFGSIERKAMSRIGVLTAENMQYAFNTIPHAWISEKADITRLEELRQQFKEQVKKSGGNLTTTAIVTKAVCHVLKQMPQFNSSLDTATNEVIYKQFYNIGIAVDTPRGLLVPVIRNADQKSLTEISVDLTEISTRTRDGKNKPDDLDGGTFTISNIGGIGGTNMLSIVNWPQVAILSMTAATKEAVWNEAKGQFEPRLMMPMTIGWDHRVINGADAARFLVQLKQLLEEPFAAWL